MTYAPKVTVNINLETKRIIPKVIIYHNIDYLIDNYTEDYLEQNMIFTFCFDTTPLDRIADIQDYTKVLEAFPRSNRVFTKLYAIGLSYEEDDYEEVIDKYIKTIFDCEDYEVVDREECYTKIED